MANQLLRLPSCRLPSACMQVAAYHSKGRIGNRDIVGFGYNGSANYADRVDFPMPALRFKENTPDVQALREKEKGDWKKLTVEEKKALYRVSFCQTFSELKAPTGEWKSIVGLGLIGISLAFWSYMWMKTFVYPPLPETFSKERQKAQLERIIALRANPVDGVASNWDYEENRWKK